MGSDIKFNLPSSDKVCPSTKTLTETYNYHPDLYGDVAIIEGTNLPRMLNDAKLHAADFRQEFKFLIVLIDKTSTLTEYFPVNIIRVSQPYIN